MNLWCRDRRPAVLVVFQRVKVKKVDLFLKDKSLNTETFFIACDF